MSSSENSRSGITDRGGDGSYKAPRLNCTISDFDLLQRAGDGSFSTVVKSRFHTDGEIYALKIVDKHFVMRHKYLSRILLERNVLDKMHYDGIVQLKFTFQDVDHLYFAMEYVHGGELFAQIHKRGNLELTETRFYAAEMVLILEYLRTQRLIHRDLKPENLLLTIDGHLKLIDFGCVKDLDATEVTHETTRRTSFVGTADYVAPETLRNDEITFSADLWGLGCLVYQMLAGRPPFRSGSEYLTYEKISKLDYSFPEDFPSIARRLVEDLLQLDPFQRIGSQDLQALKRHVFFDGIPWGDLRATKAPDYLAPAPPEDDGESAELDWELKSLKERVCRSPH